MSVEYRIEKNIKVKAGIESCLGKHKFATVYEAKLAVKGRTKNLGSKTRGLGIYKCNLCSFFHLGSNSTRNAKLHKKK